MLAYSLYFNGKIKRIEKYRQMIKHIFTFFFLVSIVILFQNCKSKSTFEDYQPEMGYDYFPLQIGKYRTYVVDSILYDIGDNNMIDTTHSRTFVKHVVADTIIDNLGRSGFKIERYERLNDTLSWEIKDIWTAIQTEEKAEWIEENLRFIKMVFPLKEGTEWDGNKFIDISTIVPIAGESVEVFKSWDYEILSVDETEQIGNFTFENISTISQANSENLIEIRYSQEKYAKEIGLVYREMQILDTQCITECIGLSWEDKAEKGYILRQQILDYN